MVQFWLHILKMMLYGAVMSKWIHCQWNPREPSISMDRLLASEVSSGEHTSTSPIFFGIIAQRKETYSFLEILFISIAVAMFTQSLTTWHFALGFESH